MIGRRKTLRAISMKDFKKRIAKNARKGVYDKVNPKPRPVTPKTDTIIKKKPVIAARPKPKDKALEVKAIQGLDVKVAPVLRRDSLITLGGEFLFAVNSYNLKTEHFTQLDSLSKFLLAHPTLEVSISGHTDNTGDEKHNVTLSAKRAEGVAQYLINKGVSDERVFFEGFGSSKPIRENDTPEGRGKNRRVEILIREPKK
ncbi:hypothetical protein WSM22_31800 [Cytophagales bacterium WSM2-2]|nr:hypothetical protein WSM22_31800 [Cytophagales bacterium WSM2-2]